MKLLRVLKLLGPRGLAFKCPLGPAPLGIAAIPPLPPPPRPPPENEGLAPPPPPPPAPCPCPAAIAAELTPSAPTAVSAISVLRNMLTSYWLHASLTPSPLKKCHAQRIKKC